MRLHSAAPTSWFDHVAQLISHLRPGEDVRDLMATEIPGVEIGPTVTAEPADSLAYYVDAERQCEKSKVVNRSPGKISCATR